MGPIKHVLIWKRSSKGTSSTNVGASFVPSVKGFSGRERPHAFAKSAYWIRENANPGYLKSLAIFQIPQGIKEKGCPWTHRLQLLTNERAAYAGRECRCPFGRGARVAEPRATLPIRTVEPLQHLASHF